MLEVPRDRFFVQAQYQPILRQIGLDVHGIFKDKRIVPWRTLPDRQNCTLDVDLPTGVHVRWHVKRYQPERAWTTAADDEVKGHRALAYSDIPTAPLVGYGKLLDQRSFVIFDDLTGYKPADKLVEKGTPFEVLLEPTADLAAKLHNAGLHHRDLYLCHFMARIVGSDVDLKLIDTARVRRLPGVLTRGRWVNKDLAQFWYSTLRLAVTDDQRNRWLERYVARRGLAGVDKFRRRIERKVRSIARHDERIHRERPGRDVSIPD